MERRSLLSVLMSTALLFAIAGCDSSPTGPSGLDGGATLHGRVRQPSVGAATQQSADTFYRGQSMVLEAATVVVLDALFQEIATVSIVNGTFTLRGLPEMFYLRFLDASGQPIGGDMPFRGVKPNQEVDIVVAVQDGTVVLVREKRTGINHDGSNGIEIDGTASNVAIPNAASGDLITGSLDVNGYHVVTRRAETSIRKGNRSLTLQDIAGKKVHVRGVFEGADVFAQEIKLQDEDDVETSDRGAAPACTVPDPAKPKHILICHKGRTNSVSPSAWPGHYGHGDTCGPCGS